MPGRTFELDPDSHPPHLIFRATRNWTAAWFCLALAGLQFFLADMALDSAWWESEICVIFCAVFLSFGVTFAAMRHEIYIRPETREILAGTWIGGFGMNQSTPFDEVRLVRITLHNTGTRHEVRVCIVCDQQTIEVPPGRTPRQMALLLAITMDVRLVKIYRDDFTTEASLRAARLSNSDQENVI